jgi:ABC-type spermidine/putrescine transport system permease subunit II
MNTKKVPWLVIAIFAVPLVYLLLMSLVPEDKIVGFHWPK